MPLMKQLTEKAEEEKEKADLERAKLTPPGQRSGRGAASAFAYLLEHRPPPEDSDKKE